MKNKKLNNKIINQISISKIALIISVITLIILCFFSIIKKNNLSESTAWLEDIESINSGVQRIAKLELENNYSDELISELEIIVDNLKYNNSQNPVYFNNLDDNTNISLKIDDLIISFENFVDSIKDYRLTFDRVSLFTTSEKNYEISENLVKEFKIALLIFSDGVSNTNMLVVYNIGIIAILLIKILLDTLKELNKNKELSKEMYIDTSTGLYNRAKCQEILSMGNNSEKKERAIIIFDLNDLKKTNDLHGHRAGDDLITCFALQLKNATNAFQEEIFVGRYGGDEFMAYFNSAEVKDVEAYLKEVDFCINHFNDTQNKPFKLSCAAGYSITTPETKNKKIREIFDEADENMYKNKIAMKEKKRQELLEQGVEVEEHHDDRLS